MNADAAATGTIRACDRREPDDAWGWRRPPIPPSVGEAVPELDQMLSDGERRGNEFPPARELTVQILDEEGISPPA